MPEDKLMRIFLADDHPLLRTGLRLSLSQEKDIEIIGEASDGFSAVEKIQADHVCVATSVKVLRARVIAV